MKIMNLVVAAFICRKVNESDATPKLDKFLLKTAKKMKEYILNSFSTSQRLAHQLCGSSLEEFYVYVYNCQGESGRMRQ